MIERNTKETTTKEISASRMKFPRVRMLSKYKLRVGGVTLFMLRKFFAHQNFWMKCQAM